MNSHQNRRSAMASVLGLTGVLFLTVMLWSGIARCQSDSSGGGTDYFSSNGGDGGGGDTFNSNSDSGAGGDLFNGNSGDDGGGNYPGPYPTPPPRFPCGPNALENQAWGGPAASGFLGMLAGLIVPNCIGRPTARHRDQCPQLTQQDKQNEWSISNAQELAAAIFAHYKPFDWTFGLFSFGGGENAAEPIGVYRVVNQPGCTYLVLLAGTEFHFHQANNFFTDILSSPGIRNEYFVDIRNAIRANVPPGSNVIIAGHSLGGMEAQNFASSFSMTLPYHCVRVITFGSPKTANESCPVVRFATHPDPVPLLSFGSITGIISGRLPIIWIYNPEFDGAGGAIGNVLQGIGAHLSYPKLAGLAQYDALGNSASDGAGVKLILTQGKSVAAPGILW